MGTSGSLGRYIVLSPEVTIWVRCVIGALALYLVLKIIKHPTFIGWGKDFRVLMFTALFLGLHWVTYFYALKMSSVAIGMLSLFSYPVITAILEPFMLKTKHKLNDLLLAMLTFCGVFFLVPEFDLDNGVTIGVGVGVISAVFYAFRNIIIKKSLTGHSGITVMYYQLVILSLMMWPVMFLDGWVDNWMGIKSGISPLLLLGLLTTAGGHTLFVMSLKHFTVTTVSILSCLSPLFGVLLGYWFLDETPEGNVLIGGGIILVSVVIESVKSVRK